MNETIRSGDRAADAMRPVRVELGPMKYAEGSALIDMGDTRVLVSASVENRVPPFLRDKGLGWVTAEYAMLPRATSTRSAREVTKGKPSGRSSEIQRLIGRSLRAVVDRSAFPDRTLYIDCDVLQADGGTRTAAITGAWVAMVQAFGHLFLTGDIKNWPVVGQMAAVSAGVVQDIPLLDLEYSEDSIADVDMNVVATRDGSIIEIQGTGETRSFSRAELDQLIDLALGGIARLGEYQDQALEPVMAEVRALRDRPDRRPAEPRDEKDLWGAP
ncbi:MAG: ribonuclease PH [Acidobacteriota bacterium]